ncbi:hypothetical protein F4X86_00070 [Candidatus Saccharibacteria bacterium]|nr:hypothetical protein [Candidatus Saccharibacteria bacterium]
MSENRAEKITPINQEEAAPLDSRSSGEFQMEAGPRAAFEETQETSSSESAAIEKPPPKSP